MKTDPQFMRPAEVDLLIADPIEGEARTRLEAEVSFQQLIEMMVDHDLEAEARLQAAAV